MANTLKFGGGTWATKEGSTLAYNDQNDRFKPLPFTTTRASGATRVNKEGLIEVVGNDVPRIDYTDSADGVLLLEPQRTNYIYPSTNLADWASFVSSGTVTRTNEYGLSPDGTNSATRIQMSGGNSIQWTYQNVSNSVTFVSFYAKSTSESEQYFRLFWNNGSDGSDLIATNEWKRFEMAVSQSSTLPVGIATHSNLSASDILIWGFQGESGSYATSYIPTNGSTVTRQADTASGSGNSEVFNDSEGVLMVEGALLSELINDVRISISDGTSVENRISFRYLDNNELSIQAGFTNGFSETVTLNSIEDYNKIALVYNSLNASIFVNGFEVATNTMSALSGLSQLQFNRFGGFSNSFYGKTKEIGYYDTALTDEELEYITSYRSLNEMVTELNLNEL